ncbi:MAG: hypothetical protein JSR82_20945 [Verrucomicrobia bacterium]|nr:hypothetical protein [Verrucomicrobiota bacterium]
MTFPLLSVGGGLVILGMEWWFHFWRKLRWDPFGTLTDEIHATVWTWQADEHETRISLGSLVGAGVVIYGGACLFCLGLEGQTTIPLFSDPNSALWLKIQKVVLPAMLVWGALAAWLSQHMHHPILPAVLADFLGTIFRAAVAISAILLLATAIEHWNGNLLCAMLSGALSLTVLSSTWTGGLGRWERHDPDAGEDPTVTTAADYPFSYLALSAFILLLAYLFAVGTPSAKG